jgi:hypothetical protein
MIRLKGLAEKLLSGPGVPRGTQHEINGVPLGIDSTIRGVPLLLDLDIGLIDAVGVVRLFQQWPAAPLQFRGIALDPTKHGRIIDGDAAFPQEFFHITIAQGVAQVPTDAE